MNTLEQKINQATDIIKKHLEKVDEYNKQISDLISGRIENKWLFDNMFKGDQSTPLDVTKRDLESAERTVERYINIYNFLTDENKIENDFRDGDYM